MSRRYCSHVPEPVDAVLPDGTIVEDGLTWEPTCDESGCSVSLMMEPHLLDALDDWAEHTATQADLLAHLEPHRGWGQPHDFLPEPHDV